MQIFRSCWVVERLLTVENNPDLTQCAKKKLELALPFRRDLVVGSRKADERFAEVDVLAIAIEIHVNWRIGQARRASQLWIITAQKHPTVGRGTKLVGDLLKALVNDVDSVSSKSRPKVTPECIQVGRVRY